MGTAKIIEALIHKGYTVNYFENAEASAEYLNSSIDNKTVGFGDSATLLRLNLFDKLISHNEVFDPQNCKDDTDFINCAKKCLSTQIYITSVNALSEMGHLVNIDGTGNRIAGSLFGHEKVYFVVSTSKVVPTLEDAIWRARNIAAPQNAKRLQLNTPCAKRGDRCYDCSSPDRICNGMIIHFSKMNNIDMEIVLINEKLGF